MFSLFGVMFSFVLPYGVILWPSCGHLGSWTHHALPMWAKGRWGRHPLVITYLVWVTGVIHAWAVLVCVGCPLACAVGVQLGLRPTLSLYAGYALDDDPGLRTVSSDAWSYVTLQAAYPGLRTVAPCVWLHVCMQQV